MLKRKIFLKNAPSGTGMRLRYRRALEPIQNPARGGVCFVCIEESFDRFVDRPGLPEPADLPAVRGAPHASPGGGAEGIARRHGGRWRCLRRTDLRDVRKGNGVRPQRAREGRALSAVDGKRPGRSNTTNREPSHADGSLCILSRGRIGRIRPTFCAFLTFASPDQTWRRRRCGRSARARRRRSFRRRSRPQGPSWRAIRGR